MRHTMLGIIPVRLQHGVRFVETKDSSRRHLSTDTTGGLQERLTRESMDTLRETGRIYWKPETRAEKRILRACIHKARNGGKTY